MNALNLRTVERRVDEFRSVSPVEPPGGDTDQPAERPPQYHPQEEQELHFRARYGRAVVVLIFHGGVAFILVFFAIGEDKAPLSVTPEPPPVPKAEGGATPDGFPRG